MEKDFHKGIKERLGYNEDFKLVWHDPNEATDGYQLKWIGKDYARFQFGTLPDTIVKPDAEHNSQPQNQNSQNIFITGDNLQALKHLQSAYRSQVDMIYIDPPYNTGGDGFVYNDKFEFSDEVLMDKLNLTEEQIKRLHVIKGRSSHSAWLTFMYPRLRLAKELLKDTGVIFISIDDNEQANLKLLCDEIFGERNLIANMVWQSTPGSNTGTNLITVTEYVLVYAKKFDLCSLNTIPIENEDKYVGKDEYYEKRGGYILNKLDRRMTGAHYSEALNYPIVMPDGTAVYPGSTLQRNNENWNYRWSKKKVQWGIKNGFIVFKKIDGKWNAYFKQYLKVDNKDRPINRSTPYQNLVNLEQFNTTQGTKEIMSLLGNKYFDYPKPTGFISYLINIFSSYKNDIIIMDFFAGSATTAHAVMQLNKEDGGSRRYIMVQLDEPTKGEALKAGYTSIDQIGRERISRASKQIGDSTGFKHYYVKPPDAATLDNITEFDPKNPSKDDIFNEEIVKKLGGTDVVLQTYLLADGYMLTDIPQKIEIAGYSAYYCGNSVLYLIGSGWGNKQTKELLNLIGQHELNVNTIICCAYSFIFESMSELETNIKQSLIGVSVEKRY